MAGETRRHCPHCDQKLAPRTFREHLRLYYDDSSRTWTKRRKVGFNVEADFEPLQSDHSLLIHSEAGGEEYVMQTADVAGQDELIETDVHHATLDGSECNSETISHENPTDCHNETESESESEYESESECESNSATPLDTCQTREPSKFADLFHWLLLLILIWHITHCVSAIAVNEILQFIARAFSLIESLVSSPLVVGLSAFPPSLYLAYKYLKMDSDTFTKYVLCPKCYSLYDYNEMLKADQDGSLHVKRCTHVQFPQHPQRNRRLLCNTPLVRPINLSSGARRLYALHCYVSKSIVDSLQRILLYNGAHLQLESWRKKRIPEGYYADVYDGKVWKSFMDSLLKQKRTIALMLNVDWFQPFKHCTDSLGALYLVIVNFPRKKRYRRQNIILAGLIPSLDTEPRLNTFLSPLISELQNLWKGVRLYTSESLRYKVLIRGALICAACDIPAARKLCGFKGHNANRGCSKCFKLFPGPVTNKDYSGFDRENWPPRDITEHRRLSKEIKNAKTAQVRDKLETQHGICFSVLSELEYFNPVLHCIVDPMHNLFLGTAKRFFKKIWIPRGLLNEKKLKEIQTRVDSMNVPSTIGRIPKKIASAFGGFTAEQWMNWTLVYSLYALRGLIPDEHYKCWESYVLACRLLTLPVLSELNIKKADLLLLHFCRKVELLYGRNEVTPNMHLHCHLADCVLNYGPISGFWLFSFERYNGMLGKFPNNQKHIEVQLMRRFETEMQLYALPLPEKFHETFLDIFRTLTCDAFTNDVHDPPENFALYHLSNSELNEVDTMALFKGKWRTPSRWTVHLLSSCELISLSQTLRHVFTLSTFIPDIDCLPKRVKCYNRIEFGTDEVYSVLSDTRYGRHSHIIANWAGDGGDIDTTYGPRPGRIQQLFVYKFAAGDGVLHSLAFAKVEWYKANPNKTMFGVGLQLWSRSDFETFGSSSYLPIPCINSKFAPAYGSITSNNGSSTHESVLFVCPLRSKVFY